MRNIEYFPNPGEMNTTRTIDILYERLNENDLQKIIVASSYGDTGLSVIRKIGNMPVRVIVISIDRNWDGKERLSSAIEKEIIDTGNVVYRGAMPFEYHQFTKEPGLRLIANTLRRFGEGMKVCVEIILMAVSGGLANDGEKVVAVAGTHRGADTAIIATAASLYHFERLEINEILCKPY